MKDDQQFFVGQKAIVAREGKVLVLYDEELGFDLPGGKIQEGQLDFIAELQREVREETSLEIKVGNPIATGYFQVPLTSKKKTAGRKIFIVYYACRHISGEVKLNDEHDSYEWVTRTDFMKKIADPKLHDVLAKYFALHPDSLLNNYIQRRKSKQ